MSNAPIALFVTLAEIARQSGVPTKTAERRLLRASIRPDALVIAGNAEAVPVFKREQAERLRSILSADPATSMS